MSTMNVTATLNPGGLALQNDGVYHLVEGGTSVGAQSFRKITTQSPYTEGRLVVASVKDVAIGLVTVRVLGSTRAEMGTRIEALIAAFEQDEYTIAFDFDGFSMTWNCEAADWALGTDNGALSGPHLQAKQQNVEFSVPHTPGWT